MNRLADALIYFGAAAVIAAGAMFDYRAGIACGGLLAIAAGVLIALRRESDE